MSLLTDAINKVLGINEIATSYIHDIPLEVISEKSRSIAMTLPTK